MNFLLPEYLIFPRPVIQIAISYEILPNICCTSATNFAVKISLMLPGDIHPNPGPVDFHSLGVCHANVRICQLAILEFSYLGHRIASFSSNQHTHM